jgi:hypothetical protein
VATEDDQTKRAIRARAEQVDERIPVKARA